MKVSTVANMVIENKKSGTIRMTTQENHAAYVTFHQGIVIGAFMLGCSNSIEVINSVVEQKLKSFKYCDGVTLGTFLGDIVNSELLHILKKPVWDDGATYTAPQSNRPSVEALATNVDAVKSKAKQGMYRGSSMEVSK